METGAKHLENHQIIRPQIKPLSKVAFFPENSHFFHSAVLVLWSKAPYKCFGRFANAGLRKSNCLLALARGFPMPKPTGFHAVRSQTLDRSWFRRALSQSIK